VIIVCSVSVAAETSFTPIETNLSDRDILLHLLTHVESMDERLAKIEDGWLNPIYGQLSAVRDKVEALEAEWATYRPVVATFANGGRPDMISAAQALRQGRRMRRDGQ